MNRKKQPVIKSNELTLFIVGAKVVVIFSAGDLFAHFAYQHRNAAFTLGLILGVGLQFLIPPRGGLRQILTLLVISAAIGMAHALIK